ncbi:branched-chain amino acid ABC transporter permease [Natronorubrum texcoconense]|uniref:Amino acid/amide ABC transporter membrane protein 1, HAAT family n=1 Tax=Natronorubrum texcoconense TaxID=1095776 RepID=A0A1G8X1C0_9EURY|nr:branched-chain amino acid ABC transporter permease [Natronorubrum texcoconense]SDJ84261.1 amino acid/amide ABC transporter membrane protein 1, HAAT family [Natronorubrum texcoconense]
MLGALISVLVTGAMISAVYALIAIGFTMIFGVGGVLNLAHGALIMIGAYSFLVVTSGSTLGILSLPTGIGLIVAIAVAAAASYVLYIGLVEHIEENPVITFLATLVVALILSELFVMGFSSSPRTLINLVPGSIHVEQFGVRVTNIEVVGFVVSWIAIGLLWYYVTRTDEGRSILATSMSERGAQLTGVDLPKIKARTWLIAGAFAGLAGVFIGTLQSTSPIMWLDPLALAFIIVVIGGIGSIKGSIVAAYLIGYLETLTVELLGAGFRGTFSLLVLVIVLLVMPQGLFGREWVHE